MVKELEAIKGAILFIDEIHTVIGAGATSGGAMDASNLLKPALAGRTAPLHRLDDLQRIPQVFREGPRARSPFQKIDVAEPSVADTIKIMKGLEALLRRIPQGPLHRPMRSGRRRTRGEIHQ